MSSPIIGIPTARISEAFIRDRLLTQLQYDQTQLAQVQTQLSTGHRFETPSEDPVAALRVMSLQRLQERKTQFGSNLASDASFLGIADSSLTNASSLLSDARATALGAMGTTATDTQRKAAADQIEQTLQQLQVIGNQVFRGRYIFAGTDTTVQPFTSTATGRIEYRGNEDHLSSFGDVDLLVQSNLQGNEIFGGISDVVQSTVDLNPVLTYDTKLADLRGGQGVSRGSIRISDGTHTSTIDFKDCATIGDMAALIKRNPPAGRELTVELTPTSIKISLDAAGGGALSIQEVGGGTTAAELGVLKEFGSGLSIEGRDLDPVLNATTSLDNLFGVRARAVVRSPAADADFIVEATANGSATSDGKPLNGVTVSLVDDALVQAGQETVVYNGGNSLEVHIASGHSTAANVVDAINRAHATGTLPFTARLDPLDISTSGHGLVSIAATATTAYGSGADFDKNAGLQIVNSDGTQDINFTLARNVEDLLNTLNGSGAGVLAEINASRTGINLRSRVSGCDFTIGENGGQTAAQLGLRTFTTETTLDSLNFGRGVEDWAGSGARANATYDSGATNAALSFAAVNPGTAWNNFTVSFTNTLGAPKVVYDRDAQTLEFQINAGTTTANDIVRMLRNDPQAGADWNVSLAANSGVTNNGSGIVAVGSAATAGGDDSGVDFTITRADGVQLGIDIAGTRTIGDLLALINNHLGNADGKLVAKLAASGNGIELVDSSTGPGALVVQRTVTSHAAIDLGLVAEGAETSASAVAGGPATTAIASTAVKSGLIFRAKSSGTDVNGVHVIFQAGAAGCVYDAVAQTLTFGITPGTTTAADVKQMLEASQAADTFEAVFDPADDSRNDGTGFVAATDPLSPPTANGGTATDYATTKVTSAGFDNDLVFTGKQLGAALNGTQISFQAVAGQPAAVTSYQQGVQLVFRYDPGVTTANDIVAALAADSAASADFQAAVDPADGSPNDGSGVVDLTDGSETPFSGGQQAITGADTNAQETSGVFSALLRLRDGLLANDQYTIERSITMLDSAATNMNYARADLGAREQAVQTLQGRLDDEKIELSQAISVDYDADMTQVISQFAALQANYQAALQASAKIMSMTLLDYL